MNNQQLDKARALKQKLNDNPNIKLSKDETDLLKRLDIRASYKTKFDQNHLKKNPDEL